MKTAKKYSSLLVLLLFLIPQVESSFHSFSHRNDSHCTSNTQQHFHQEEHVCSICDFNIPIAYTATEQEFEISLLSQVSTYVDFNESPVLSNGAQRFSPRAPPLA